MGRSREKSFHAARPSLSVASIPRTSEMARSFATRVNFNTQKIGDLKMNLSEKIELREYAKKIEKQFKEMQKAITALENRIEELESKKEDK